MQRTPRAAGAHQQKNPTSRRKKLANAGLGVLLVLVVAAGGTAVMQSNQAREHAAQAADNYTPPVTHTAPPQPTKAAFLGDSFTAGSRTSAKHKRWSTLVAKDMGWIELNYGYGGTNYGTAGTLQGGQSYADRLTDLTRSKPDIVIVSSAGNTMDEDQQEGITDTFQQLRKELPDAQIIATSPYYRAESFPASFTEFGDEIKTAVEAIGGEYVDIGHPLADHPEAMDEDMIHPNDAGHALIAEAVQQALEDS